MKRNTLNLWIDLLSFLVLLGLILTGLLINYVLPPGTGGRGGGYGLTLWGWDRHDYGDLHFYLALAVIALMVVHLWLHWSWVIVTINRLLGRPAPPNVRGGVYGIALLVGVIFLTAGGLYWAKTQVRTSPSQDGSAAPETERDSTQADDFHRQTGADRQITGQTTLTQAAQMAGMPVAELIQRLKLPPETDTHERLGRLKRRYGFDINDVRKIVQLKQ